MREAARNLHLSQDAVARTRALFSTRIREGLEHDGRQIKGLRAYLPPPQPPPDHAQTHVAVIDVGGTNCRAAVLRRKGNQFEISGGPLKRALPVRRGSPLSRDAFFEFQADLLEEIGVQAGLPLGYCFSYPAEVLPTLDARLIRWTKGIEIDDVVGRQVGRCLADALSARGVAPSAIAVLNDTVAGLLGGAIAHAQDPRMAIGLIVGTGSNMAGFFDQTRAPKLSDAWARTPMAINLESGNFDPPPDILTEADAAIDRMERPGAQRFEKAVSGHYLPYLFAQLMPNLADFDPQMGGARLDRLVTDPDADPAARDIATALVDRSADLVAAGLAAMLDHYPPGHVGILAEGAQFWSNPRYATRVEQTLTSLTAPGRFAILHERNVNLVGAACAATTASHGPGPNCR